MAHFTQWPHFVHGRLLQWLTQLTVQCAVIDPAHCAVCSELIGLYSEQYTPLAAITGVLRHVIDNRFCQFSTCQQPLQNCAHSWLRHLEPDSYQ